MPSNERDLFAIIDLGSNSVRLVIYNLSQPGFNLHLLNEKQLCELGKGLKKGEHFHPESKARALAALARFAVLLEAASCRKLAILATAAVREASDGPEFVREVEALTSTKVRILGGKEEARLSALGVFSTLPEARGWVADVGGGSLELAWLEEGRIEVEASFALGTLKLSALSKVSDLSDLSRRKGIFRSRLGRQLEGLEIEKGRSGGHLYLVGGTFRALAGWFMNKQNYPIRIAHRFSVKRKSARKALKKLIKLSNSGALDTRFTTEKRAAALPYVAALLLELMQRVKCRKLVFSSYGLREGFLFGSLPFHPLQASRQNKPLEERISDFYQYAAGSMGMADERFTGFAKAVESWLAPLDLANGLPPYLFNSTILLSDYGWHRHPSYKAEETVALILHTNRLPFSHSERVFIAMVLARRYGQRMRSLNKNAPEFQRALKLLPESQRVQARTLGTALRLAYGLSLGIPGGLNNSRLERDSQAKKLRLFLPQRWEAMASVFWEEEFAKLAEMLSLSPEVLFV